MPENFYDLLGVDEDATQADLKQAYRQRAREFHPDVNADDRAGAQFKTIRRAYDVLRDENERSAYDRLGHTTYVRKRMKGGLPDDSPANPSSSTSSKRSSSASSSSTSSSKRSSSSGSSTSSSRSTNRSSSSSGSSSGSNRSTQSSASSASSASSSTGRSQGSQESTASRSSTDGRTGTATDDRRTDSGGRRQRRRADRTERGTSTDPSRQRGSTTADPSRRYTPNSNDTSSSSRERLRNRWLAVATAFVLYLGGLGWYGLANRATLLDLASGLSTDPVASLVATGGFGAPAAFARTALTTATTAPSPALLVPLGTLVLPLVLVWTVSSFGRGSAWLYVVAAFGPLVGLAVGFALPAVPTGAYLAVFVVLPVVAVLVFLGDVGRYLVATR